MLTNTFCLQRLLGSNRLVFEIIILLIIYLENMRFTSINMSFVNYLKANLRITFTYMYI